MNGEKNKKTLCSCHEHEEHHEESSACKSHGHEQSKGCSCHGHEEHHEGACACASHGHEQSKGCACHGHEERHEASCACKGHEHEQSKGCSCHGHEERHEGACSCGYCHGDEESAKRETPRLFAALALFAAGMLFSLPEGIKTALLLACYLVSGYEVLLAALRSFGRRRLLDENFLMAVASLAAIAIGEITEGCAVMLFYQIGELFQGYAVGRSRRRVKSLLALHPQEAFVLRGGEFAACDPAMVAVGETIRVRPGERVPLDAIVTSGAAGMDTSALTGESLARTVQTGDPVLAGFVNCDGVITAQVTKPLAQSSISRILQMVEEAQERKAPAERFITAFARVYTPIVVGIALLLAIVPPLLLGGWHSWLYRALTFLVASCPCALVISVPLCYFAGIGSAARRGILVKGGDSFDALQRVNTFVLDKTGTLTTGEFAVTHVQPADGYDEEALLALVAGAEKDSRHPLAQAIVKEAELRGVVACPITLEREIAGRGVIGRDAKGQEVIAGSLAMMQERGICAEDALQRMDGVQIYAAAGGRLAGVVCLSDTLKPDAKDAMAALRAQGVRRIVMLTGDRQETALEAALQAGIDEVHAHLMPQDKLNRLEEILASGAAAFVGDGVNDAPALTRADVGIAMGALGSDAAIEAADIVLMNDDLESLPQALAAAKRVRRLARQNIAFALAVKAAVLGLAVFGMAGMWAAVFADVGVALICVLNAMRALSAEA